MKSNKLILNMNDVLGGGRTYEDLLRNIGINPETVVVLKDGGPVPVDDQIQKGEIMIIRVVSSG
ncbi:MAG: thiamine biosynthesis protein ThiS [Methanotrichaceae archaeon]|nr:thiamine biosynthesis protein ThiS [Methanotrichaceae archaeon]